MPEAQRGSRKMRDRTLSGGLDRTQELYHVAWLDAHAGRNAVLDDIGHCLILFQGGHFQLADAAAVAGDKQNCIQCCYPARRQ